MSDEVWSRRRTSFGSAAEQYATGRPHYPRTAIAWCLPVGARQVLDLGAGTGILTGDLLDAGLAVTAVEPLAAMRAQIPTAATILDGTAESIPVDDGSVDAVFVGQAWHWFDAERATAEVHRVLRQGGRIAPMWNLLDVADDLTRTVADIIEAEERSDMMLDDDSQPPFDALDRFTLPEACRVKHEQRYDVDRVVAFALSRSQSILLAEDAREAMLDRLRSAVPHTPFTLSWICEAWRATALKSR